VVVGLVLERAGTAANGTVKPGLENAAVLIDADGIVRAQAAKRFLWHFDREWFVAGDESPVEMGVGMLVCADARLPEIAVDLAGRGARIIANPTAWVTSLPPPEGTNSQAEFLWRVRAFENRVVGVAATKVGTEADTSARAAPARGHIGAATRRSMALPGRLFAVKPAAAYGRPDSMQATAPPPPPTTSARGRTLPYFAPNFSPPAP